MRCACCFIISLHTAFIKARVKCIEILAVETIGEDAQTLAEALVVGDLTLSQEFERLEHVGIVDQTNEVVVGRTRFLLGSEVFVQIGDGVALGLEHRCIIRLTRCRHGIDTGGVIDEIRSNTAALNLFLGHIFRQLIDDGGHHFQVGKFLRAY